MTKIAGIIILLMLISSIGISSAAVIKEDFRTIQERISDLLKTFDISGSTSGNYIKITRQISDSSIEVLPGDTGAGFSSSGQPCANLGYVQIYTWDATGHSISTNIRGTISCPTPTQIVLSGLSLGKPYRVVIFAWQGASMGYADFSLTPYIPTPTPTPTPVPTTPRPPTLTPTLSPTATGTPPPSPTMTPQPPVPAPKPIPVTSTFAWFINMIISAIRGITGVAV